MTRITCSTVLEMPIEAAWAFLRDFKGADHSQSDPTWPDSGHSKPEVKVGAIRRIRLADGLELRERLLTMSDIEQCLSYCLLETPVPLFNCVTHQRLFPVTDSDHTVWIWDTDFDVPEGQRDLLCEFVKTQICETGFRALQRSAGTVPQ